MNNENQNEVAREAVDKAATKIDSMVFEYYSSHVNAPNLIRETITEAITSATAEKDTQLSSQQTRISELQAQCAEMKCNSEIAVQWLAPIIESEHLEACGVSPKVTRDLSYARNWITKNLSSPGKAVVEVEKLPPSPTGQYKSVGGKLVPATKADLSRSFFSAIDQASKDSLTTEKGKVE